MNSLEKLKVAVWNVDKCILVSRGISVDTTKPLWNREEKTSRNNLAFTFGQFHYQGHNYHSHSQKWEEKIIKKLPISKIPKPKPTFEIGIFFPRFSSLCKDYLVHNMYITSVLGFPKCIIHVKRIKTSKLKYYKSTYKHVFSIR